jgi:hypothetical protein
MEPNVKLLMEEMLKQVCEEIQVMRAEMKEGFTVHKSFVNNHVAEFTRANFLNWTSQSLMVIIPSYGNRVVKTILKCTP